MRSLSIIYASTSGHTEFTVDCLIGELSKIKDLRVIKQRAELTKPEDLIKSDILILASSTWNTNNVEGQLNPHMYELLLGRAKDVDLKNMPVAAIGLGDDRYFFTARAADTLSEYIKNHNGNQMIPALKVINEPFDQEPKIKKWAAELSAAIKKLPAASHD